ncbi:MAG: ATP-binding protein [Burkholderiales bacterium]|nr:ATP-binding protein [Burkholderiales bacterium]MDE2277474.1 ATP-binding protein [Burkholderiales bacterium]
MLALQLANQLAALEPARQAVLDFVDGQGLSVRARYRLELVLEEVLMNLVWHAFPEGGSHAIDLTLQLEPDTLRLGFEDDGAPFDPLAAPLPVAPRSLAEAVPGGLGLALVRKAVREARYERVGGRNRLTLALDRG